MVAKKKTHTNKEVKHNISKKPCGIFLKRYVHPPAYARLDQSNQIHFSKFITVVTYGSEDPGRETLLHSLDVPPDAGSVYITIIPGRCYLEGREKL